MRSIVTYMNQANQAGLHLPKEVLPSLSAACAAFASLPTATSTTRKETSNQTMIKEEKERNDNSTSNNQRVNQDDDEQLDVVSNEKNTVNSKTDRPIKRGHDKLSSPIHSQLPETKTYNDLNSYAFHSKRIKFDSLTIPTTTNQSYDNQFLNSVPLNTNVQTNNRLDTSLCYS